MTQHDFQDFMMQRMRQVEIRQERILLMLGVMAIRLGPECARKMKEAEQVIFNSSKEIRQ